jgi:hypothetical protein
MAERDSKLEEGLKDTEIRRDTQVRGSLGIPPSGESDDDASDREADEVSRDRDRDRDRAVPELDLDRMRNQSEADEDDRMSER